MEISLENRQVPVYLAGPGIRKQSRITVEGVVPDSEQDMGRVASVSGTLLLKGKDLSAHGVSISGELQAALLCVGEDGRSLSMLRLSRPFTLDFETGETDSEALPQLRWSLSGAEGRLLNSRKVSASFEISAQLLPYRKGDFAQETLLPDPAPEGLHLLPGESEAMAISAVCEKPFAIREQFPLAEGSALRADAMAVTPRLQVLSTEQVGDRAIVKGSAELELRGLTDEGRVVRSVFRTPFSQLLETGQVQPELFDVWAEPNAAYFDLVDTVSGEKALDAELHGVLQLCCWEKKPVSYLADAYSSRMPCRCLSETRPTVTGLTLSESRLSAEEPVPLFEDFGELLDVEASLGTPVSDRDGLQLPVSLDLLCRDREGRLSALRRSLRLAGPALPQGATLRSVRLEDCSCHPAGESLETRLEATVSWEKETEGTLSCLRGLSLDEDAPFDLDAFPSVTLVRRAGQEDWTLAKTWHTSVEAIRACNPKEAELLLIPRE